MTEPKLTTILVKSVRFSSSAPAKFEFLSLPLRWWRKKKKKEKIQQSVVKEGKNLAERGFDPRTSGLWAQHASTAPLCLPAD